MADWEELLKLLRSDKVTHRKKGRTECDSRLFRDRLAVAMNPSLTMSFLHGAVECEITEINLSQNKEKSVDVDISTFFRNMVKYCCTHGQLKSHKTGFLFEHILDILCNEDLPVVFKNNHKNALTYLLVPSALHSMPFNQSLKNVIIYLKDIMVDTATLKDPLNHKLLKATCMCMFGEDSCQAAFVANVLVWFVRLLQQTSEDTQVHALVTATVCECCASFLKYQGVSLYSIVNKELEVIFQAAVKYLCAYQFRETHKDAYYSFLDVYLQTYTDYREAACLSVDVTSSVSGILTQLGEYLLSEVHIRSLVTGMRTHPAHTASNKDGNYVSVQEILQEENSKWMTVYTIMARLVRSCNLGSAHYLTSKTLAAGPKTSRVDAQLASSQHPSKRMRTSDNRAVATPGPASTNGSSAHHAAGNVLGTEQYALATRISAIQLNPTASSAVKASNYPVTPAAHPSNNGSSAHSSHANGRGVSSHSAPSSSAGRQYPSQLLEGHLVLLLVSLRAYPTGIILHFHDGKSGINCGVVGECRISATREWVLLIKRKLEEILQFACEPQLLGVALLCLVDLCKLSKRLLNASESSMDSAGGGGALRSAWAELLVMLTSHPKLTAFCVHNAPVRKDTVFAHLLQLLRHAIAVVDASVLAGVQGALWRLSQVQNPALVDSPVCFRYLASLVCCGGQDVPAPVTTAVAAVLHQLGHQDLVDVLTSEKTDVEAGRASTRSAALSRSNSPSFSGLETNLLNQNLSKQLPMVCLLAWLYAQLSPIANNPSNGSASAAEAAKISGIQFVASASSHTRFPVSHVHGYVSAVHRLVLAAVTRSDAGEFMQCATSSRDVVSVRSNVRHWVESLSVEPPAQLLITDAPPVTASRSGSALLVGAGIVEQLSLAVQLLSPLLQQLLSIVTSSGLKNEASEQFNAWQTVSLLALAACASLLNVTHDTVVTAGGQSPAAPLHSDALAELRSSLQTSFLLLAKALLVYTEKKVVALKLLQVSEYFDALANVFVLAQPSLAVIPAAEAQLQRLRTSCINSLVKSARVIHSIVLSKGGKAASKDHFDEAVATGGAMAVDDDEFMEHGIQQSTTNRANLEDSGAEDGGDGEGAGGRGNKNVLLFSKEQLQAFAAVSKCAIALQDACGPAAGAGAGHEVAAAAAASMVPPSALCDADAMNKLVESLFSTESFGQVVKLQVDAESKLILAQAVTTCSPSGTASIAILNRCPWHLEWGSLGYCKVLQSIHNLLSQPAFWATADPVLDFSTESVLGQMVDFVLPQDNEILESYLLAQWRCRYEQLQCIGQLMRHADVSAVKGAISPTFLSAFADTNSSVRFCAAGLVPLLLPLFKKTQTVYASLLKGTGIALVSPQAQGGTPSATQSSSLMRSESSGAERPLDVVALAVGIASMGGTVAIGATGVTDAAACCTHPLARQALLDLIKLSCSRQGAGAQVVGKTNDVNYRALLHLTVWQLAQRLGYERVDLMLREYLRWLVHEWLLLGLSDKDRDGPSASQSGGLSQSKSSAQRMMTLADFPFSLLSDAHSSTLSTSEHSAKMQEFLRTQSSTIVPVICQLEHTRYRWSCILQYATAAGYGSTDRDVAVIVKRNVCALKALELTLQCAGNLRASTGQDFELMSVDLSSSFTTCAQKSQFVAQSVQEFVTRSSSAAELSVYLTSKVTDTVSEVFLLQTAEVLDDVESSGDTSMAGVATLLSATLKQVGGLVGATTLSELFDRCNLLDLLSTMHVRLLESRKESVNSAVLAMLQLLVRNHPAVLAKSFLSGILHVLHNSVNLFPQSIAGAVEVLDDMVAHLIEKLVKPCDDGKKVNPSPSKRPEQAIQTAEEIARFAPEMLSECLLMLKFAALQLNHSSDPTASTALKSLVNTGKLDRLAATDDGFTLAYFSRSACLFTESHGVASAGSALAVTVLQISVAALNMLVQRILRHCSNTFNTSLFAALLPLPKLLHGECFQQSARDYSEAIAHLTVQDRIRSVVSIVQNKISGELLPLSFIWLQVQIICGTLLPVLDPSAKAVGKSRDEGSGVARSAVPVSCSWNGDVDLLSTFLSTLVGLCKHCEQQTQFHLPNSSPTTTAVTATGSAGALESTAITPVQQALRQATLRLLGHFGAPDLLSLSHTKFPLQTGHLTKESNFDVECMKQRLLLRAFALLWSAPSVAKVAAGCLRDLTCVGYFATLQSKFDSTSTLEGQLLELSAAYMPSVIGREKKTGASGAGSPSEAEEADLWSAQQWSTSNKASYNAWICPLCYRLIDECYAELQPAATTALSTKYPITKTADSFVVAMKPLVLVRAEFAEGLMPLVIQGILKTNGVNSFAHTELSSLIATHLLAPQCCYMQATQLGCNLLTFLMRQDVTDFLAQRVAVSPRGGAQRIEPTKSQLSEWSLPFSYVLTIDLKFAAQAATRCQLTCTALLFAELSDEDDRSAAENERGVATSAMQQNLGANKVSRVAAADTGLHDLLLPIYEKIHDPDAIYGIDLCSSLELQALMYSRKGRWMEALSTYEGIIQSRSSGPSIHAAEAGIAESLRALGAQHTLQGFASSYLSRGGRTGHSNMSHQQLSEWHPSVTSLGSGNSSGVNTISPPSTGNFFADISLASTSAAHVVSVVDDSVHISALLADMNKSDATTVSARVQKSSSVLFSHILHRMCDETAANVLPYLAQAQHLTEINEANIELAADSDQQHRLQRSGLSADRRDSPTVELLHRWRARQAQSSNASQSESQFALRSSLLRKLLTAGRITALDAIECLHQGDGIAKTVNAAHAVTPQIYKFWNEISAQMKHRSQSNLSDHNSTNFADTLISASLAYCECRLLWAKGLKEASIASINTKVIHKLKLMLQDMAEVNSKGAGQSANLAQNGKSGAAVVATASEKYNAAAAYFQDVETQTRGRNLLSAALCTGGGWISTKRAATGTEILDDYLDPAVQYATGTAELIRAYTTLADFHARLYQNLKAKVHSAEWQQGARVLADRKKEYDECRVLQDKLRRESNGGSGVSGEAIDAKTLYRHVATLKKEIELDSKERESVEQSVNRYLIAAVSDFAKVLELSKEADVDCVFRLVQLWLSNCDNPQINALMDDVITSIPSYKFAPLSYQILSRLGGPDDALSPMGSSQTPLRLSEKLRESPRPGLNRTTTACSTFSADAGDDAESGFQLALCRMVLKLCTEHPHHILPQLFALAHEREFSDDGAAHVKKNLSISRLETANMLVTQLQANDAVRELVVATRFMLLAYIDLASASTLALQKVGRTKGIKFKEVQPRGRRFNEVMGALMVAPAVITLSCPLSPVNDYSNVVRIEGFQQTFSITDNGISRPKIVTCMGSDGRSYVQLVKGGDDMRQDAVMQQVFANVNFTLSRDEETQKRNLGIRTYKIIPTTPQTGILEWVQNTAAFGSLLCDRDSGAHGRYYPNDWTHAQCREHLKDAADNADKLRRYQEVCARFHPAFRFFFLEKFADPVTWVASRLAYSRSVAANSIIGYILGIGDRHAHNILMDTVTAEVVHIDFGIVFEQGKGLGTPETVPFRLTRDVVDGMGVTACEGTFRRSCEEVLRVLRDNSLQIMTILEVVIHDPLYKWSLSPLQARMKQNTVPDYQNDLLATKEGARKGPLYPAQQTAALATVGTKGGSFGKDAAERTLLRVLHKLQGQEDPSSGEALSIEGQVDLLINEARSAANLSKLFPGWAPWL